MKFNKTLSELVNSRGLPLTIKSVYWRHRVMKIIYPIGGYFAGHYIKKCGTISYVDKIDGKGRDLEVVNWKINSYDSTK